MKDKTLSGEIKELTHGKISISEDEHLDKDYLSLKAEFSHPDFGIEIERSNQKYPEQEIVLEEKQYDEEKADLQKMEEDDIVILKSGKDSDFLEN